MSKIPNLFSKDEVIEEVSQNRNYLRADKMDMSFGEIINLYSDKELIIDPAFQRYYRWNSQQKTNFIESILIGIPFPPIFVAEKKEGVWELVDGLQRISTILSFLGKLREENEKIQNNWKLEEGSLVKKITGMGYSDLPQQLQLNIKRTVCRLEIIKWNSKFDMRYELFNRLNTGGSPLTEQEIRNAIFRGQKESEKVYSLIDELSEIEDFKNLIKPTERQLQTQKLNELVLRFASLYMAGDKIKGNLSSHMTDFMESCIKGEYDVKRIKPVFIKTIKFLLTKPESLRGKSGSLSTSLFDVISYGLSNNIDYYIKNPEEFSRRIGELKNDKQFEYASGSFSASQTRSKKRIDIAKRIFEVDEKNY